jgi:hypothetical protein
MKMLVLKWLPGRRSVLALFTAPMDSAPHPGCVTLLITISADTTMQQQQMNVSASPQLVTKAS